VPGRLLSSPSLSYLFSLGDANFKGPRHDDLSGADRCGFCGCLVNDDAADEEGSGGAYAKTAAMTTIRSGRKERCVIYRGHG